MDDSRAINKYRNVISEMATSSRISLSTINAQVKAASYAVRGPIVAKAQELSKRLQDPNGEKLKFNKVISCNIGNPHALDQKSLSFIRNVLSLVINPSLITSLEGRGVIGQDAIERAKKYLAGTPDIGAYSDSQGILAVREEVCAFLRERDGYPANPDDVFLTNGASEGVRLCMQVLLRSPVVSKDGVLTPIPQYPLYSALATLLQGELVPYYLEEANGWNCSTEKLAEALQAARDNGVEVRALVVINPGNPTGQVLDEQNMKDIVSFCMREGICLMADEVYQENVWASTAKFVSFRKVAYDMGALTDPDKGLQMISFHSVSKGFLGECGLRGGYFELSNIPTAVRQEIYKLCSISLCSNTVGQVATGLMVAPPRAGEESFEEYVLERDAILDSLRRRAVMLSNALNQLEGVSCNSVDGALYAFPTITLPAAALRAAEEKGMQADALYCMELLDNTGIVVVPGSGFGQREGTQHFRTTILPPEDKIADVIALLSAFHADFLLRYSQPKL